MENETRVPRRRFIQAAAAAMPAAAALSSCATARPRVAAPSGTITLGVIGAGPRCRHVLPQMLTHPDVRCVAVADVRRDRRNSAKAFVDKTHGAKDCAVYRDFRELLARGDIDAVLIATGDRWHAPASILAAEAGKDVYSEKPCGLTIANCQALADTMRRTGRVFQAGTQRRSVANFQKAVELAHSGKLGRIHTLHATAYVPEIKTAWLPGGPTPAPDDVDWNLWLGPAPWRPYNPEYLNGGWRAHWDFESGARLLDWGAHTVDLCQWANRADGTVPLSYEPDETGITARYANGVTLRLHFLKTPFEERPGWIQALGTCPVRFEGDEGWVEVGDSGGIELSSDALKTELAGLPKVENGIDVLAHTRNFLDCVKSRGATAANPGVMRRSHIACHAAALSWILGRKLEMDPKTETFLRDDEANRLRTRPERDWTV
ncbi:MAG: Gfo/Idh/MocA family oxidoreductase [Candidatus Hydrogenedentes bacterium]|nr:Gfo/Idh/MocA family oxidoreductase [Candidatus Hydrogenedentota bacterium]